MQSWAQDK